MLVLRIYYIAYYTKYSTDDDTVVSDSTWKKIIENMK